jgi:hypothetical protein
MSSSKHTKIKERLALAQRITATSIEMPPCDRCEKKQKSGEKIKCIVSDNSRRCSECVRTNARCDAGGPSASEWEKLEREERRLQEEEEEAMAKILRLRKQQRLFRSRAKDMLRRGLQTMDELDEVEERERQEQKAGESTQQNNQEAVASPGPSADLFESLSPSFWEVWGADAGTPPTSQG